MKGEPVDLSVDQPSLERLRNSVVDVMAMAEAFGLIATGELWAGKRKLALPFRARLMRLARLCQLEPGETWQQARERLAGSLEVTA